MRQNKMITLKNVDVKFFPSGSICWIDIKVDDQDYDTIKAIGRGRHMNSYLGTLAVEYKGNTIFKHN
jgi:hypothetical protein